MTCSRRLDALSNIANVSYHPVDANRSYLWQFWKLDSPEPLETQAGFSQTLADFAGLSSKEEERFHMPSGSPEVDNLTVAIINTNRRITLLHDLQTHIEEFDGSLFELHQAITLN